MLPPSWSRLRDEVAWLAFLLPRQAVQELAHRLPLAALRDHLPPSLSARLRLGLYPARVSAAPPIACARVYPPWGVPAQLDPARPVAAAPPRASLVLVTHDQLPLTRLCLASLQRHAGPTPFEVIVVDNASSDGSDRWLQEAAARGLLPLRVVANRHNRGFAPACNQGAALARGEHLVFLNNDTVVTPAWLEPLLARLDGDPAVGLIGPSTNSCGNEAEVATDYADLDQLFAFAARFTAAHRGVAVELPMLTLFCTAIRRRLFEELGGLDERYRVGLFEDDDLSLAVQRRGLRTVVARDSFVHHYGRASFASLPPARYLRLWWENRRRFEAKWGRPWQPR